MRKTKRPINDLSVEEYMLLLKSGMLWEIYPEATGSPSEDLDNADENGVPHCGAHDCWCDGSCFPEWDEWEDEDDSEEECS